MDKAQVKLVFVVALLVFTVSTCVKNIGAENVDLTPCKAKCKPHCECIDGACICHKDEQLLLHSRGLRPNNLP
ncbi:hypothetical protein LINPERPRIM_LOCUS28203 [Linum perenne]